MSVVKSLITTALIALVLPTAANAGTLDTPQPDKAPTLTLPEARHELRKLWFTYFEQVAIVPHFDCKNTAPNRVVCNVWLRFPGSSCVSRSAVVETDEKYQAVIHNFKCKREA